MKAKSFTAKALLVAALTLLVAGVLALTGCSCSAQSSSSASASSSASSGVSSGDKMVVPNVVSLTQADADKALAAAGFAIGTVKQEASDTVPQGHVISQDPKAFASAASGTKVNLVISSGKAAPQDVKVPDLKGKTQADAEKALADAKLVGVASNPEESTEVAPGQVFKQSVAAGTTVKEGTRVAFTVAIAPDEVTVPDVTGKSEDDAKAAITGAKLNFDYTVAYNESVAANLVVSQSVAAGTKVRAGTTVSVVVSLGAKPAENVKVPDVTTYSWSEAEATLKSAGLQARYTGDPAGVVVSQDVAAGTEVAPNTLVTVKLESTVETVTVPNLVGMSVATAEETTDKLGLALDIVEGGSHGTVKDQSPAAGTEVPARSTVNIWVDDSDFKPQSDDASKYLGTWKAEGATLEITQNGDAYTCTVTQAPGSGDATTWKYDCTFADGKLVAKNTGTKTVGSAEPAYTDGSATFTRDGDGKLTWKDEKEDAGKGLVFAQ